MCEFLLSLVFLLRFFSFFCITKIKIKIVVRSVVIVLGGEKSTVGGQTEDSESVARFEMLPSEDIFIGFRNISTGELRKRKKPIAQFLNRVQV